MPCSKLFCFLAVLFTLQVQPRSAFIIHKNIEYSGALRIEDPPCSSEIFCHGKLLHLVQMSHIYNDSKTFVDMKLKYSPDETLTRFEEVMRRTNESPSIEEIRTFIKENFLEPGEEFETWNPNDWSESPRFLNLIQDSTFKKWGSDLNDLWKLLGRKMKADVAKNGSLYSIIHVPNPVIVPGGRFREFYYWDSYWIVRGLLYSEMHDTARGMLNNFLSIIQRYGFIPNGGRIYYSKRSQPPLLAAMIKSYIDFTGDEKFGTDNVEILEHEFQFWINNHSVHINNSYNLYCYGDKSSGPRPESYREDIETSKAFDTDEAKEEHYAELKAAAESGMDFSSRWFINNDGTNQGTLKDLKTRSIIPVELNAILYWNAKIIADLYIAKGNLLKAAEYETKSQEIFEAIQAVLWNDEEGVWLDYDMINNKPRKYFTPTNLSPLWMKCYNISESENISGRVLQYIKKMEIDQFPGGVPNSLYNTGEQWDFPNVWPPMQYILILGLDGLGTEKSKDLALKWASRWVQSNFIAYKETSHMFEKYNAETFGGHGSGGEYEVQLGFGWTNGVIIELLAKYGSKLTPASGLSNRNES